jgi:hypothetical protein
MQPNPNDTIMSKIISSLIAIALFATVAPLNMVHASSNKALKIKSANVETDRQRVIGEVKVCNTASEDISFKLDAKNMTINSLYQRNLSISANSCEVYELNFTKNFAEMSNTGDEIVFSAKYIRGAKSENSYRNSKLRTVYVKEGNSAVEACGDASGEDGVYTPCVGDFVDHEASGLRIKVKSLGYNKAQLLVTHVRWGGVKSFRIYKNRSKKIVSGDDDHTQVELSSIVGENSGFTLQLESLK